MSPDDRARALEYVTPSPDGFWKIGDQGETFEWCDGRTILFRAELASILQRIGDRRLPPFNALLWLVAATRDNWPEHARQSLLAIFETLGRVVSVEMIENPGADERYNRLYEVFDHLRLVSELPPDLRHSPITKAELIALTVDYGSPLAAIPTPAAVLEVLERGLHAAEPATELPETSIEPGMPGTLLHDWNWLCTGLRHVDADRLALRIATGLDTLPAPVTVELKPSQQIRALLETLSGDRELAGLAQLARNLMGTAYLPRPIDQWEELPLGGVSDITNRGPLDRLLASELAHDDLTLAVRIAMNEALYLRRESPPRRPPRERRLLLDVGLRSWGIPRLFATAVALALAGTDESERGSEVLCANDGVWEPVNLRTHSGLVAHLASLSASIHPSAALEALETREKKSTASADTVLVTTADTMADPRFSLALARSRIANLHVATVDRNGEFKLFRITRHAHQLLREAQFSLENIVPEEDLTSLIDSRPQSDAPAIMTVQPFPLRLSHQPTRDGIWFVQGVGAFTISHDLRLMLWDQAGLGARQLGEALPAGQICWSETLPDEQGIVRAVLAAGKQRLHLLSLNTANLEWRIRPLQVQGAATGLVFGHRGKIYVHQAERLQVFDANDAQVWEFFELAHGEESVQGRFFRVSKAGRTSYFALSTLGRSTVMVPFPLPEKRNDPIQTVFDCAEAGGPVAVTWNGHFYFTATERFEKIANLPPGNFSVEAIAGDGSRVILRPRQPGSMGYEMFVVTVASRSCTRQSYIPRGLIAPEAWNIMQPRNVRHRFHKIAVTPEGRLALTTARNAWWALDLKNGKLMLCQVATAPLAEGFRDLEGEREKSYRLRVARWADGSTAWIDSRGLLHLRSSNRTLPDVSLVLSNGELGGWLSDQRLFGDKYYLGREPDLDAGQLFHEVLDPFVHHLPC